VSVMQGVGVCVCVGFVRCGWVYVWFCNVWVCVFVCVVFVMCGSCNVWVCACVGFVICVSFGNVYLYLLCFVLFRLCICFLTCFVCAATE
jgi:hypothetical protein